MRPLSIRILAAAVAASVGIYSPATAEDIDLFTSPTDQQEGSQPNILIVLDNSANWSRNDQAWPTGKQGESELEAIRDLLKSKNEKGEFTVSKNVNLGLMMLTSGNPADGGYVRFAVQNMDPAPLVGPNYRNALIEMIGEKACVDGPNSVTGKANCILKNFDSPSEKTNSASTRYSAAMYEAFKYFGGWTSPPRSNKVPPEAGAPEARDRFGTLRYAVLDNKADPNAYSDVGMTRYKSPINEKNACARNYVIFIGNGFPSQDNDATLITNVEGSATVPPPIAKGNNKNYAANWTKYNYTTDVSPIEGRQRIVTYTIDVFNAKPDAEQTALLQAMAKFGGGNYFAAKKKEDIIKALEDIITEIQSVSSVFASASLPINATNRSQNENQVFIGMFRPHRDAKPRWFGNLKQYQIAIFGNGDARLADKDGKEAILGQGGTGFIQACASSFWTTDSGNYWEAVDPDSAGTCPSSPIWSDLPDGAVVEKGGTAEVVRRGNDPAATSPFSVKRNMYTCSGSCGVMTKFTDASVTQARTGALTVLEHKSIIDYTLGLDVQDENKNLNLTEPRPTVHGDIAHSRPLPVNYGAGKGVVSFYGANDGTFKAVEGRTGVELWSFVAPEHHRNLKRLHDNAPKIAYPGLNLIGALRKDYFWDGSAGLYQNADDSEVWIFPTMRRGGRMVYGFDVKDPKAPLLKWAKGCPVNDMSVGGCSPGYEDFGQTWSVPNVAFIKGYEEGKKPVLIMGGGYDPCEDEDAVSNSCTSTSKGAGVYVIDANDGSVKASFKTERSVAADVTLIDRDFDGKVDHAYIVDTGGNLYRWDFVDSQLQPLELGKWPDTLLARTQGAGRKFLFGPSALAVKENVYLAVGSGDRERPLEKNYPYQAPVMNRFYMFIDAFDPTAGVTDLDGPEMDNFSNETTCSTVLGKGQKGWYMNLTAGTGEQTVTSSVIFGGTVFFSTNRPTPPLPGQCGNNLGEARGYAVNLFNASGVIGSGKLCGGDRSGSFTGGGLPPSPVVGTVPVKDPITGEYKPISVLIGGIDLKTGTGSPIGAQQPPVPLQQIRSRVYWYPHGDK